MTNPTPDMQAKQQALLLKARKGILQFIQERGGQSSLADIHDFSMNKFFIQHQAFSRLMESLVEEKLLTYDFEKDLAQITDAGKQFLVA